MSDPMSDEAREIARGILLEFIDHWLNSGWRARPSTVCDVLLDWAADIRDGKCNAYGVKVAQS